MLTITLAVAATWPGATTAAPTDLNFGHERQVPCFVYDDSPGRSNHWPVLLGTAGIVTVTCPEANVRSIDPGFEIRKRGKWHRFTCRGQRRFDIPRERDKPTTPAARLTCPCDAFVA